MSGKKKVYQTGSFQTMVETEAQKRTAAAVEALEPMVQQYATAVKQEILKELLPQYATLNLRMRAIEDILGEKFGTTKEEISARIADLKDAAFGLKKSDAPAKAGDQLALTLNVKSAEGAVLAAGRKILISNLGSEPFNLPQALHEKLVGATVGTEVSHTQPIKNEKGEDTDKNLTYEVTVDRISEKLVKETPNVEAQSSEQTSPSSTPAEGQ